MSSYVGIDVAKLELVVHVLPQEQGRIFANSAVGLAELVVWLQQMPCQRIVFEASGGYEQALLKCLCPLPVNLIQAFLEVSGQTSPKETADAQEQIH